MRLCALNNIEAKTTGTEAHSSLGLGERYHDPLRNTFRKMKVSYPDTPDDYLLFVAVKAMNDTLGLLIILPDIPRKEIKGLLDRGTFTGILRE